MIKPIETHYRGHRFRSRLEARWAVFFDALGLRWEYEREGFDLGPAGQYLPDFWLPQLDRWMEVKGQQPNQTEVLKAQALADGTQHPVIMVWAVPGDLDGCMDAFVPGADLSVNNCYAGAEFLMDIAYTLPVGRATHMYEQAVRRARRARFGVYE